MDSPVNFQISDFLELGDWEQYPQLGVSNYHQNHAYVAIEVSYGSGSSSSHNIEPAISENRGVKERVAFKTRTHIEVLDDGFKWRKYGKKKVKNSPNPRNYYKCSFEGCPVKKRVERDSQDYGILITTYDGVHNHESPTGL